MALITDVRPIEILLVEDNPADADLMKEALHESKVMNRLTVADDGERALAFLNGEGEHAGRRLPDLVLLDLNLPGIDGKEVLEEIRATPACAHTPVVVVTSSKAEEDIVRSYKLHCNAYVHKPVDFSQFHEVIKSIENFWLATVVYAERA